MRTIAGLIFSVVLLVVSLPLAAQVAQGTAFTYQGELRQNNLPVTGSVDMVFTLYDAATVGTPIGAPIALSGANAVSVVNGIFTVSLDFGGPSFITMTDDARWLEVRVASNTLSPRTKIENAPYALTSQLAYSVVAGSIGTTQINAAQVQRRVTGTCAAGSSISVINSDGTVSCQSSGSGAITSVTGSNGVTSNTTSGVVTLSADTTFVQKRVGSTCPSGSSISAVDVNGGVTCQAAGTGTVTSITAGNGLTGGTITGSGTLAVDPNIVLGTTWNLAGNANLPAGSFLGTTDNESVLFKVNNVQAGQLQSTTPPSGTADSPNVIFGSSANSVAAGVYGATIGGGGFRTCSPTPCTPNSNYVNSVTNAIGTVSGGAANTSAGFGAFVGGGNANLASGTFATVGGGQLNTASGGVATVAGGAVNKAIGGNAAVPGGQYNVAGGDTSFAAGLYAHVRSAADIGGGNTTGDQGTFVWSDSTGSSSNQFTSTGPNQFLVRATGGVGINTTPQNPNVELTIRGNSASNPTADLTLVPNGHDTAAYDIAVTWDALSGSVFGIYQTDGAFYSPFLKLDGYNLDMTRPDSGANILHVDGASLAIAAPNAYKPGGGSWSAPSDARLKREVQPLAHMLDKLLQLRGVTFEYKQPDAGLHPAGRHTGFIAQEVQQVFPEWVGQTPDGYLSVGPTGFEAMTVEALRELRAEKDDEIAELHNKLDELSARLDRLQVKSTEAQP